MTGNGGVVESEREKRKRTEGGEVEEERGIKRGKEAASEHQENATAREPPNGAGRNSIRRS
jgi:hypothetical protein